MSAPGRLQAVGSLSHSFTPVRLWDALTEAQRALPREPFPPPGAGFLKVYAEPPQVPKQLPNS
jgi:hypothetical protein